MSTPIRRVRALLLLGLAALAATVATALPAAALAQSGAATPDSTAQSFTAENPAPRAVTALDAELTTIRETFRDRLSELTAAYAAAPDAEAAASAQRDITALKLQLEIDLLELQLRRARERGDTAAVAELEPIRTAAREHLAADAGPATPAATAGSTRK